MTRNLAQKQARDRDFEIWLCWPVLSIWKSARWQDCPVRTSFGEKGSNFRSLFFWGCPYQIWGLEGADNDWKRKLNPYTGMKIIRHCFQLHSWCFDAQPRHLLVAIHLRLAWIGPSKSWLFEGGHTLCWAGVKDADRLKAKEASLEQELKWCVIEMLCLILRSSQQPF